jgi:hypothetical protein
VRTKRRRKEEAGEEKEREKGNDEGKRKEMVCLELKGGGDGYRSK